MSLNLTHTTKVTYDNILPKLYERDPAYSSAVSAKIAEMVSSGKTDGETIYSTDDNTIYRNFTSAEAANEWLDWVYSHNENPNYPNITFTGVSTYTPPIGQTEENEAVRRARILGSGA